MKLWDSTGLYQVIVRTNHRDLAYVTPSQPLRVRSSAMLLGEPPRGRAIFRIVTF